LPALETADWLARRSADRARPWLVRLDRPVDYTAAEKIQETLVAMTYQAALPPTLLLLEHPLVVTLGRGAADSDAAGAVAPVVRSKRGGSVTVHGPGQLIGYPIANLRALGLGVAGFVAGLESVVESVARRCGVPAHTIPGRIGLWTPRGKIASIGIAVRHGVAWHGWALYLRDQRANFGLVSPCNLPHVQPDAVDRYTQVDGAVVADYCAAAFARQFGLRDWLEITVTA
jgi:lipoate-protein ligase B